MARLGYGEHLVLKSTRNLPYYFVHTSSTNDSFFGFHLALHFIVTGAINLILP